jgi:hypothetical protein
MEFFWKNVLYQIFGELTQLETDSELLLPVIHCFKLFFKNIPSDFDPAQGCTTAMLLMRMLRREIRFESEEAMHSYYQRTLQALDIFAKNNLTIGFLGYSEWYKILFEWIKIITPALFAVPLSLLLKCSSSQDRFRLKEILEFLDFKILDNIIENASEKALTLGCKVIKRLSEIESEWGNDCLHFGFVQRLARLLPNATFR